MATNKILPWAQTGTANVLSDDAYAADVATGGLYGDGVKAGQASSQQANKTWRQATAPASGLGQFLVDNLNVDVTDSDTPATFSSRIANAILKLAQISPFNQSFAAAIGGYRKYAIVSDSSGNFWVSTADQNVTVPGASGSKWQNLFNGYATQSWSNSLFATIEALSTETSSRASADTNLQNQINNRVLKTGDTMTGSLSINTTDGGVIASGNGGGDNVPGGVAYSVGFQSSPYVGAVPRAIYRYININGVGPYATMWLTDGNGRDHELRFGADDRLRTASGNVFALTSETVSQSQYQNDFATSDSRVINLAYGHRIQAFETSQVNAGDWVTFPQSFSGRPQAIMLTPNQGFNVDSATYNWSSTGFNIYVEHSSNVTFSVIAIGPK